MPLNILSVKWRPFFSNFNKLWPIGVIGDIDLGQHWLRYWLGAWRHWANTWTNVNLPSMKPVGIITEGYFTETVLDINDYKAFENRIFENTAKSPKDQWVNVINQATTLLTRVVVSTRNGGRHNPEGFKLYAQASCRSSSRQLGNAALWGMRQWPDSM